MNDIKREFYSIDEEDILVELKYSTIVTVTGNGTGQVNIELLVDPEQFLDEAKRIKKLLNL